MIKKVLCGLLATVVVAVSYQEGRAIPRRGNEWMWCQNWDEDGYAPNCACLQNRPGCVGGNDGYHSTMCATMCKKAMDCRCKLKCLHT